MDHGVHAMLVNMPRFFLYQFFLVFSSFLLCITVHSVFTGNVAQVKVNKRMNE